MALGEAALVVVTEFGLRGLTHRAVDRQAGLPNGTTSAYYRSRHALQAALAELVTSRLGADIELLAEDLAGCGLGEPRALSLVEGTFVRWLHEGTLLQARLELALEATRDADLARVLLTGRARIVDLVAGVLAGHDGESSDDAVSRAEVVVAAYDGVLLAALLKPAADRSLFLDRAVAEVLGSLSRA